MYKKLMVTALTSLFMFNASMAFALNFSDVPNSYWAYTQIKTLTDENVISGYGNDTFKPENKVTRAEFSSMLVKALNQQSLTVNESLPYPDVAKDLWSYNDINKVNSLKLVVGYPAQPSNIFKPNANITKTEALVILANTLAGRNLSIEEARDVLAKFIDGNNVPNWAKETLSKTIKNDVYVKYPNPKVLSPQDYATRAEVADLLYQIRKNPNLLAQYKSVCCKKTPQPEVATVEHLTQNSFSTSNEVFVKKATATIVQGNVIETAFVDQISGKEISEGTPLRLQVVKDLYTNEGTFLIPAGSIFIGTAENYEKAKLFNRNAKISFCLNKLVLPSGKTYDLSAQLASKKGYLSSRYNMKNFRKDVIIVASTTVFGTGVGALAGIPHHVAKATGIGAYSAAGAGVLAAIVAPGVDLTFNQGDKVYIKLVNDLQLDR